MAAAISHATVATCRSLAAAFAALGLLRCEVKGRGFGRSLKATTSACHYAGGGGLEVIGLKIAAIVEGETGK